MNYPLNVSEVLNDIDFEIAQGVIARQGLGEAIQAVRQYQNVSRTEVFKTVRLTDRYREAFSRLFQIVDMLLNLVYELGLRLQSLQRAVQQLRQLPAEALMPVHPASAREYPGLEQAPRPEERLETEMPGPDAAPRETRTPELSPLPSGSKNGWQFRSPQEVERAIRPEAIMVELQARVIHTPIIGWLLTKLRIFYQRPALFYSQILANRQAAVNRVLGDRILYLEELVLAQQRQLEVLHARLEANEEPGKPAPTPPVA
jgi:hypothetical protein